MQKDMHYFGTYAMARAAGLKPDICQTIATATEFVDDNIEKEQISFADGGHLDVIPTAHHKYSARNINHHDQRLVWLPFHFIPGNKGSSVSEQLVCQKDSQIAREMVEHNLAKAIESNKDFGPHLMGITAHVYADTFSHYGFSGVSSRRNRIDSSSLEFMPLEPEIKNHFENQAEKFPKNYGDEAKLENFRGSHPSWVERHKSDAAEALSGALGHAAVLTYPDRPFLKWKFNYEYPSDRPSERDNPATFLEGCEKLHALFRRLTEAVPAWRADGGRDFADIREAVRNILVQQKRCEERIEVWGKAARDGTLFVQAEEILPYQGEQWQQGLDRMKDNSEHSSAALEQPIFRFFQAAALHRTFVLRELLPRHNLVVD